MTTPASSLSLVPLSPDGAAQSPAAAPTLGEKQRAIVLTDDRHLMAEAGAGSGKTTVLIEKILHEIGHGCVPGHAPTTPLAIDQIAAITFTKKAAGEILERLRLAFLRRAEAASGRAREAWAEQAFAIDHALIGTIDSFAGRLIRDYGGLIGLEAGYDVLDGGDAEMLRQEVAEAAILRGIDANDPGALFLVRQFGYLRARGILCDWFEQAPVLVDLCEQAAQGTLDWQRLPGLTLTAVDRVLEPHSRSLLAFAADAHAALEARMAADGVLDFAHVLLKATQLAGEPAVQAAFRDRVKLLFVDEHQDTNPTQVRLLFRLAGIADPDAEQPTASADTHSDGATTRSVPATRLVLIGDPKQSIYGFRSADITMWDYSKRAIRAAGGSYVTLRENHRSRPVLNRFFDDCLGRVLGVAPSAPDDRAAWQSTRTPFEVHYTGLAPKRTETPGAGVEVLLAKEGGPASVAEVVAERIAQMLQHPDRYPVFERRPDGSEHARPLRRKDIAILSRNLKGPADHYERALQDRGISSYIYGGRGLYGRQEIQDLAALLRAVADPHDPFALAAFLRSPLGGVDDLTITELATAAAAPGAGSRQTLFEALSVVETIVVDPTRQGVAVGARSLLLQLRAIRDRVPHHHLLSTAIEAAHYKTFLAGAPDAPAGLRNVEKLLQIARHAEHEPLFTFVHNLAARVRREDAEGEAPIYSPDDDLVAISTIHKAKGLEWPVVFVVGLDDRLFQKPTAEEPKLAAGLGVVLPLDVVIRGGDGDAAVATQSAVWDHYVETQKLRDYAEAKRLFYVACTRARDHLVLAGALKQVDGRTWGYEQSLDPDPKWMHNEGAERWLRHLYRSLTQSGARGQQFHFGTRQVVDQISGEVRPAPDVARIRRGLAEMRETDDPIEAALEPTAALGGGRQWPDLPAGVVPAAAGAPIWPAAIAERLVSFEAEAHGKCDFSASELMQYLRCEWRHMFGFRYGISTPVIMTRPDDALVNQVLPAKRGDILHDYLSLYEAGWDEARCAHEMRRAFLRHLPDAEALADDNVVEMLRHARHYLASPWYARVAAAHTAGRRVYRERPFFFQLTPSLRFNGKWDVLWEEADGGIYILDFKTGLFRHEDDKDAAMQQRVEDYELQAALYALVAEEVFGPGRVKGFVFLFTGEAEMAKVVPVTKPWIERWEYQIRQIVQNIRGGMPGPRVYEERKCKGCEFMNLCKPAGMPLPDGAESGALVSLARP